MDQKETGISAAVADLRQRHERNEHPVATSKPAKKTPSNLGCTGAYSFREPIHQPLRKESHLVTESQTNIT